MTTYHELDHQTISAFLSTLRSAGFLPESHIELNRLYHCRTDKQKDRRFAWYKLAYSKDDKAFVGTYGSFTLPTQREYYPVGGPATPEARECAARRQQAAERTRVKQQAAEAQRRANAARRAAGVIDAVLALREQAGGNSPYLNAKQLAIVDGHDAFVLTGKQLLQAGVNQVQAWEHFASLPFLVVCMKDVSGRVMSLQFISHERTAFVWAAKQWTRIIDDKDRKSKLFLAGGAAKGAFLHYGAAVTACKRVIMCEGYAKMLAVLMAANADDAVVCAFSVGNYVNVLAALKPLAPDAVFVLASDNDKAGRAAADKLLTAYRDLRVTFADSPCKDADDLFRLGGVDAVRRMLARQDNETDTHILLTPSQHLSDARITLQDGLQWLIADTGLGKTRFVMQYARTHADEMVMLAAPTNGICEQGKAELMRQGEPFQLVMQGASMQYHRAGLTLTTWASLARKFDVNAAISPVTLFVDEAHLLSSESFRQGDIAALYALFSTLKRVVFMTATPHLTHACGLQHAPKIYVTQANRPATPITQLFYPASEYAVIRHFVRKGRVICEMNSKRGMAKMAKMLQKDGVNGVYCMNADNKADIDGVYRYVIDHERLPADCRVLLTTKLGETGLNIRDTDIQTVLIFAPKPLEVTRRPESIPLPHDCKQMANRMRCCLPDVFLCLQADVDRESPASFDGGREYARLRQRAKRQRAEYRQDIANGGFDMAKASYEGALRETTPRVLYFADNDCHLSACGLDMAVNEKYTQRITYCGGFREQELNKHGLTFAGNVMFDALTADIALTQEQAANYLTVSQEVNAETDFKADIDRLTALTDAKLRHDDSPFASRLLWLRKHFEQADAAAVLKTLGSEAKAFSQFKARVNVLKGVWQKDRVHSAAAISDFLDRKQFTGKDSAAMLTDVFRADRVLQHELDDDWRTRGKRVLCERRALAILRKFADIQGRHTTTGAKYVVVDRCPVSTLYRSATGKTLSDNKFFSDSIFAVFLPSSPTIRAKTYDRFTNKSVYRKAKLNVSGLNDLQAYLASELHDADTVLDDERAAIMAFGG